MSSFFTRFPANSAFTDGISWELLDQQVVCKISLGFAQRSFRVLETAQVVQIQKQVCTLLQWIFHSELGVCVWGKKSEIVGGQTVCIR